MRWTDAALMTFLFAVVPALVVGLLAWPHRAKIAAWCKQDVKSLRMSDRALYVAGQFVLVLLVMSWFYPPLHAATYGTVKANEARVIDATSTAICMDDADTACGALTQKWWLRHVVGSEVTDFYTSGTAAATVNFRAQSTAVDGTPWMVLNNANGVGTTTVFPYFPNSISLGGTLAAAAITMTGLLNIIGSADAADAITVNSSDSASGLAILGDGTLEWPDGVVDTNLYRSAANTLTTDDDFTFAGSNKGLLFGHMYVDGTQPISIALTAATPADAVDDASTDGWLAGELNTITFPTGGTEYYITIVTAGMYRITWDLSFSITSPGGSVEVHGGLAIGGTPIRDKGEAHRSISTTAIVGNMGATTIYDCTAGNCVASLWVESSATKTMVIEHGNLNAVMIGGT